jgi:DNA polymerase III delta subunit
VVGDASEVVVLRLIASSDDFLLEERLAEAVSEACKALDAAEAEIFDDTVDPERLAVELRSPSLFTPTRVLVVPDVRGWLETTTPQGAPKSPPRPDLAPLLEVLGAGMPEGMALVLGAWCGRRPKGALVDAIEVGGDLMWIALPEPPKPWEDVTLSDGQRELLGRVLRQAAGDTVFSRAAATLLMDRLGFAPRYMVQEVAKLVAAAGEGREVDEALVRSLTFPADCSLDVARAAILKREPGRVLDVLAAADLGVSMRDWQGRRVDRGAVPFILIGSIGSLLLQLLVLRLTLRAMGLERELSPQAVDSGAWYRRKFQPDLGPRLLAQLAENAPNPVHDGGRGPSLWSLSGLVKGATRWTDDELTIALEGLGRLERQLRGEGRTEAFAAWLGRSLCAGRV